MKNTNQTETGNSHRRTVLQGIAALGIGSTVLGTAQAHDELTSETAEDQTPVGIQLFTISHLDESVPEQLRRVAEAGFDAAEPFTLGDDDPSEIGDAFEETSLENAGAHVGLEELEEEFEATVDAWTTVGVETFVIPSVDEKYFQSAEGVREIAGRINAIADRLEDHDLKLSYHNHEFEFVDLGNQTAYECFVEHTNDNVLLQIDTGLVAAGGQDPVVLIAQIGERVDSLHVRDMRVGVPEDEAAYLADGVGYGFVDIGEGDLNLPAIAAVSQSVANVRWLIYEHQPGEAVLERAADLLSTMNMQPYSDE